MKTDEELLAEAEALDACYAQAAAFDEANAPADDGEEHEEPFDPVRWGWVDKRGRP